MTHDDPTTASHLRLPGDHLLQMHGPADMAAMLPYLLGFYPDDSIVAVALYGPTGQHGGAIRADIPEDPNTWPTAAAGLLQLLVELSEERERRPDAVLIYLCRDPEPGARPVVTQLRPLADQLLLALRALGVRPKEALCVSGGRWWSYLCTDPGCCDPDGTSVVAGRDPRAVVAAATYAGLAPRGSRKAIAAAFRPISASAADAQRHALELELSRLIKSLAAPDGEARELEATQRLIAQAMAAAGTDPLRLDEGQVARLLVGLQNRTNRDCGAEYAEPDELVAAQRLWRFLTRRCVPPYDEFAKAPLTLLAWTSWLAGDTATTRVALAEALELDPAYTLADLLYHSLNSGLEPDGLLRVVRAERVRRAARGGRGSESGSAPQAFADDFDDESSEPVEPPAEPVAPAAGPTGRRAPRPPSMVEVRRGTDRSDRRTPGLPTAGPAAGPSAGPSPSAASGQGVVPPQRGRRGPGESQQRLAAPQPPPASDQSAGGSAVRPEVAHGLFAGLAHLAARCRGRKANTTTIGA
ncbi:DUF4192 domain-containing protein [Kitasatospora sp. NBC_01287]|uniref:DUF4192 domain-containing protein n=1 Tax=Kitasatospora sp. NBC_01287 TaxID=2903573 RepID=UPI0022511063|nr:DUF4192 domain-containing protein [Kitasatospora sp. NBC_01287]MCX4746481.1 DUF4192 domain-containing protein [Kitasatospora sp. NBC_01287]